MKKVLIGSDHAGFELKNALAHWLGELGYPVEDKGAHQNDPDDDYPDFIFPVARAVSEDPESRVGIVIGGSGQGEAMAANRIKGVRAALFYGACLPVQPIHVGGQKSQDPYDILRLTRQHNNSNVLSLGARFLSPEEAKTAVKIWLETPFGGEERHARRLRKLAELGN